MWTILLVILINGTVADVYSRTDGKGLFETQAACLSFAETEKKLLTEEFLRKPLPEGVTWELECQEQK